MTGSMSPCRLLTSFTLYAVGESSLSFLLNGQQALQWSIFVTAGQLQVQSTAVALPQAPVPAGAVSSFGILLKDAWGNLAVPAQPPDLNGTALMGQAVLNSSESEIRWACCTLGAPTCHVIQQEALSLSPEVAT